MKRFALLTTLILLTTAHLASAQTAAYKFTPAKDYKYLVEMKSNSMTEYGGETMATSLDGTVSLVIRMESTNPDGSMKGAITIDNALFMRESPQGTETVGAALAGKKFALTIEGDGSVTDIDTSVVIEDEKAEAFIGQILRFLPHFDAKDLSVGSHWTRTSEDTLSEGTDPIIQKSEGEYKVVGTKTVKGFECLEISYERTSTLKGTASRGGQDIFVNGEDHTKGTMFFAAREGILVSVTNEGSGEQNQSVPSQSVQIQTASTKSGKIELVTD